jgi:hypothetical protein
MRVRERFFENVFRFFRDYVKSYHRDKSVRIITLLHENENEKHKCEIERFKKNLL